MTNYEKYFGSPEKACEMTIEWIYEDLITGKSGFQISRFDIETMDSYEEIDFIKSAYCEPADLLKWMMEECND